MAEHDYPNYSDLEPEGGFGQVKGCRNGSTARKPALSHNPDLWTYNNLDEYEEVDEFAENEQEICGQDIAEIGFDESMIDEPEFDDGLPIEQMLNDEIYNEESLSPFTDSMAEQLTPESSAEDSAADVNEYATRYSSDAQEHIDEDDTLEERGIRGVVTALNGQTRSDRINTLTERAEPQQVEPQQVDPQQVDPLVKSLVRQAMVSRRSSDAGAFVAALVPLAVGNLEQPVQRILPSLITVSSRVGRQLHRHKKTRRLLLDLPAAIAKTARYLQRHPTRRLSTIALQQLLAVQLQAVKSARRTKRNRHARFNSEPSAEVGIKRPMEWDIVRDNPWDDATDDEYDVW